MVGYGAATKGNTLLNYAGVRPGLMRFVVNRNPARQGQFMPGSWVPIVDEPSLQNCRPDYVMILPWNLRSEVANRLNYIRSWSSRFVFAIPALEVL
ncbi:methyltransferase C-terminal domain-containing protein [Sodalinema gerasimenkoae]|uniref:methyltransferase C-terminal domain-containing protein n=1 Tax=Sodalinema gerasimenkoae TaxID=2862348 RepID=UPI0013577D37